MLPVIKFDENGKISNIDELFGGVDVGYSSWNYAGNRERSVEAWINEEDKVANDMVFIWGPVLVGQNESAAPYIGGTHRYYRIHIHRDSKIEPITKNQLSGCIK
jgi:hypothetical protein